ncbi:hypothetical protein KAJ83_13235 [Marivibrio halodurans]|uniref:Uncharacterized protein n=1 Tax=Marivibrio halodurans TaxID=2039722 RepID=A0A8J7SNY0_9PROT|nr:hypothetical protein [Marivibrio halodurans]MBP5857976.1 hypothetical protein [Marivibrio halodurans]
MSDSFDDGPEAQARRLTIELAETRRLAEAGERLYTEILDSLRRRVGRDGDQDVAGLAKDLNAALTRYAPAAAEVRRRAPRDGGGS